jgi:trigger factor
MAVAAKQAGADRRRRLFDLLDEACKFEPPRWMVQREFKKIWLRVKTEHDTGMIDAADKGKTDSQLKAEYRVIADRRVRLGLVLGVIVRGKNLTGAGYPREQRAPMVENEVVDFIFSLSDT